MTPQRSLPPRHLLVRLEQLQRSLGAAGIASVALLIVGVVLGVLARSNATESGQLEVRVALLEASLRAAPVGPVRPAADTAATFENQLPTFREVPKIVAAFGTAAEKHDLNLEHIEYANSRPSATSPGIYSIQFTARSEYPALRRFVAGTLNDQPALALRELALKRDDVQQTAIDAKVKLAIFYRDAP